MNRMLLSAPVFIAIALQLPAPFHGSRAAEPAEFQMVKKGVFKMNAGESIDLTDRGILFRLGEVRGKPGEQPGGVELRVNGDGSVYPIGYRIDLKRLRDTKEFVKDIANCYVDVVSATVAQGARPSATFRLMCE